MALNKITEFFTKWFNVCINITSIFRNIIIFISAIKILVQTKPAVVYQMQFCFLSLTVLELSPLNKIRISTFILSVFHTKLY